MQILLTCSWHSRQKLSVCMTSACSYYKVELITVALNELPKNGPDDVMTPVREGATFHGIKLSGFKTGASHCHP